MSYNVNGVLMKRPFHVRRLGHFGLDLVNMEDARRFYLDELGLAVSDTIDPRSRAKDDSLFDGMGDTSGFFARHGSDHHSFVAFNKLAVDKLRALHGRLPPEGVTVNQITWQVSSLEEVRHAIDWLAQRPDVSVVRVGRDMPGSNWHCYFVDPDGHVNELYYGIEQIGWDGLSKPKAMYGRYEEAPVLPLAPELHEVNQARQDAIDLQSGYRYQSALPFVHNVGGILLDRPFKVVKIGPVRLFVDDVAKAERFYSEVLGLKLTAEVQWRGHRCAFLRAGTEHHSLALYPLLARKELGLSEHSSVAAFGVQVANYKQLKKAISHFVALGRTVRYLPPELSPGINYSALVLDPDGHAIQLYHRMEHVIEPVTPLVSAGSFEQWPEVLEESIGAPTGEVFPAPWA